MRNEKMDEREERRERSRGISLFYHGMPIAQCKNQLQRKGWREACNMEADIETDAWIAETGYKEYA
jgi:O-methyltransferase involved in polyketide biosynthesis